MREVRLEQRYWLAFIAINSFMHLTTMEDQLAELRNLRDASLPGGLLIIDVFNPNPQRLLEADGRVEHCRAAGSIPTPARR